MVLNIVGERKSSTRARFVSIISAAASPNHVAPCRKASGRAKKMTPYLKQDIIQREYLKVGLARHPQQHRIQTLHESRRITQRATFCEQGLIKQDIGPVIEFAVFVFQALH